MPSALQTPESTLCSPGSQTKPPESRLPSLDSRTLKSELSQPSQQQCAPTPEGSPPLPRPDRLAPEARDRVFSLLGIQIPKNLPNESYLGIDQNMKGRPTTPAGSERSIMSGSSLSCFDALESDTFSLEDDTFLNRQIRNSAAALVRCYNSSLQYFRQSASNQPTTPTGKSSRSQTTLSRGGGETPSKRKLRAFDGDGDEDEDPQLKRGRPLSQGTSRSSSASSRPLACPFNKFDCYLFGPESPDKDYHVCATFSAVSIGHLKQHLKRNHYLPTYFCFSCCRDFLNQTMYANHQRQRPSCEPLYPPVSCERIGADLREQLGLDRKNATGTDKVEYWHEVYDAFFPGDAERRSVNPYYEGPSHELLYRFIRFTGQVMPQLLPVVIERLDPPQDFSPDSQMRLQQEIQQQAVPMFLENVSRASLPHLPNARFDMQTIEEAEERAEISSLNGHREAQTNPSIQRPYPVPQIRVDDYLGTEFVPNRMTEMGYPALVSHQAATSPPLPCNSSPARSSEKAAKMPTLGIPPDDVPTLIASDDSGSPMQVSSPISPVLNRGACFTESVKGIGDAATEYDLKDNAVALGEFDWEMALKEQELEDTSILCGASDSQGVS